MKFIRILAGISRIIVGLLFLLVAFPDVYSKLKILKRFAPLFVLIGIALLLFSLILLCLKSDNKIFRVFHRFLWPVSVLCMAAVCWVVVFFTAVAVIGCGSTPPENATVVVLGESTSRGVPSFNQLNGIAAAGNYLHAHPYAMCIASGGLATDLQPADATVIRDELVSKYGIDSDRIVLEDQSRTTYENMQFTEKIIKERGFSRNIAVAAPAFHLLRAEMLARRVGLIPYGVPGKVDLWKQWTNYFRELFAFPKSFILDQNGFSNPVI